MRHRGKSLFMLAQLLLFGASESVAQWYPQNSGTTQHLRAVACTDATSAFAVGDSGTIVATTDGGTHWVGRLSGTTQTLNDACVVEPNTGWVVGDGGTVLKTTNGGITWLAQESGTTYNLTGVSFPDSSNGWAVGWGLADPNVNGIVLRTTDGGMEWVLHTYSGAPIPRVVSFCDSATGVAAGHIACSSSVPTLVMATTDAGSSWMTYDSPWINDIRISGPTEVFGVGGECSGRIEWSEAPAPIFKTSDGGATWTSQTFFIPSRRSCLFGMALRDDGHGVAVGGSDWYSELGYHQDGIILTTSDRGSTWAGPESVPATPLKAVCLADARVAWTVGENGVILHTTNGGVTSVAGEHEGGIPAEYSLSQNYPNPFNPSTTILYALQERSHVRLTVFNTLGQRIATLVEGEMEAGYHEVKFDASHLPSGVYLYRLHAGNHTEVRKAVLMK